MAHLLRTGTTAVPGGHAARRPRRGRGEDGMSMAMTMVVVVVVFSLGAIWLTFATQSTNASGHERRRQQAVDAANAGLVVAASELGKNKDYSGTSVVSPFPGGSAQYEVTVANDTSDASGLTRIVTAIGHAPSSTASPRASRTLRQVVQLVPQLGAGTFTYAIQSGQGIVTGSNSNVTGDIYANQKIELGNSHTHSGSIFTLSNVKLGSNTTVTGNIWAKGEVDLDSSSSLVQGSVTTQNNIKLKGQIGTSAVATGSIEGYPGTCSKVGNGTGTCKQYTQVEAPSAQSLPTFTFVASNYPYLVTYPNGEAMVTALANETFSGTYYANSNVTFNKNQKWYLNGDTTIMFKGHLTLPGEVVNTSAGGQTINLRVISIDNGDIIPSNNMTIPDNIRTLLYGGKIGASGPSNSIRLTGAIAAADMSIGASFHITYAAVTMVPGFTFSGSQPVTHYNIRNVSTREIPTV